MKSCNIIYVGDMLGSLKRSESYTYIYICIHIVVFKYIYIYMIYYIDLLPAQEDSRVASVHLFRLYFL